MPQPRYHALVFVDTNQVGWSGSKDPDYFAKWFEPGTVCGRGLTEQDAIENARELAAAARMIARKEQQ